MTYIFLHLFLSSPLYITSHSFHTVSFSCGLSLLSTLSLYSHVLLSCLSIFILHIFISFLLTYFFPCPHLHFLDFQHSHYLLFCTLMSFSYMQFHPLFCHHCLFLVYPLYNPCDLTSLPPTCLLPCFLPPVARCCRSTSHQVCTSWVLSAGSWPSACSSSSPSSTSASGKESRRLER